MALPDILQYSYGTPIIWGPSGGTSPSVTHTMSVDGLANGSAWQGNYADLGADWDVEYEVYLHVETGTAPTAGNTADVYLVCTWDTNYWPAKVTGSDGSYTLGTSDANLKQAGSVVQSLIVTNDANTELRQAPVIWKPKGRYVTPILDNNLGQAIRDEATNSNNNTRIILVPRRLRIND